MPERNEPFWTEERVEFLREWRSRGTSAASLAAALSTTKNAVVGKCARLKLPSPRASTAPPPAFVPRPPLRNIAVLVDVSPEEIEAWTASDAPRQMPTSVLDRRIDQCAAVLNARSSGDLAMMCGQPTIIAPSGLPTSWCADHYAIYHRKDDHGQTG